MTAPAMRRVNALNGNIADRPSQFFKALSEADHFCREVDDVQELRARVGELEAENRALAADLTRALDQRDSARQERDTFRAKSERRGW